MANVRAYYANQGLYIKPAGATGSYEFVPGVQSASDSYEFPIEYLNMWGQIGIYEAVDGIADVTFDCEKLIDGSTPLYLLATEGASAAGLSARSEQRCVLGVAIYPSDADYITGNPTRIIEYSGMQPTSLSYTFNVDGAFTESISFLGSYAEWAAGSAPKYGTIPSNPTDSGEFEPPALTNCSGGVQFKENLRFDGTYPTLLPTFIPGITSSGTMPLGSDGCPTVPIQSITVSTDMSRETINQLGCKLPYARPATFPVDVTTEIEILSQSGHGLEVTEDGAYLVGCEYTNAPSARIRIATDSGLTIDLGSKNKLTSSTQTYGDVGGTNSTYSLSFTNKSVMSVFHVNDPSAIVYAGSP